MKRLMRMSVLSLLVIIAAALLWPQKTTAGSGTGISFQVFYDNLAPYGRWINDRDYGRVWIPDAERDFQPYATRGHWIQTGYGNTWVSDYPWGWAPFHYGRWVFDDYYGWAWIPGDEWGPGWVDWRSGDGYYGWAPSGPSIRISINIPLSRWVFVPQRYLCHPDVYNYRVFGNRGTTIFQHTTVINNYYAVENRRYNAGPRLEEIQRVTNHPVQVYTLHNDDRPGRESLSRSDVRIYRPQFDHRSQADENISTLRGADIADRTDNYNRNESNDRRRPSQEQRQSMNQQRDRAEQTSDDRRRPEIQSGKRTPDRSARQRDRSDENPSRGSP